MERIRLTKTVNGKSFQITSDFFEKTEYVYRDYIVSREGLPVFFYQLAITSIALLIYNHKKQFNPSEKLLELGIDFICDMIRQSDFSKESGIITSLEMSKDVYDWKTLQRIEKERIYTQ